MFAFLELTDWRVISLFRDAHAEEMRKKKKEINKYFKEKYEHSQLCVTRVSQRLHAFVPICPNICASYLNKINRRWQDVGSLTTSETCSTVFPNSTSRNFQSVLTLQGFHEFTATCPNKDAGCTRLRMNLQINLTLAASCCKQMPLFTELLWVHPLQQFCQKLLIGI